MQDINKKYLTLLKDHIVIVMQKSFPGIHPSIADWKGQEISDFQEELLNTVNAHISEKWFYTHMKSDHKSLPRIDILNLLSQYVGYKNWDDFVFKNGEKNKSLNQLKTISTGNRFFMVIPILALLIMAVLFGLFHLISQREVIYSFQFYDSYTREPISSDQNELILLSEDESALHYYADSNGKVNIETPHDVIKIVAKTPYYKTDTITRILRKLELEQQIRMQVDDYALILHYFSTMNTEDWQKRRTFLEDIIDETALFYQVISEKGDRGILLYNKVEFIDKLTMPTGSLKHIDIIDTKFKKDKIVLVRFRIKNKKDE